jgi:hypothetical protein
MPNKRYRTEDFSTSETFLKELIHTNIMHLRPEQNTTYIADKDDKIIDGNSTLFSKLKFGKVSFVTTLLQFQFSTRRRRNTLDSLILQILLDIL